MPREKFEALLDHKKVSTGYTAPSQRLDIACLNHDLSPNATYVKPADDQVDDEAKDEFPRPDMYIIIFKRTHTRSFSRISRVSLSLAKKGEIGASSQSVCCCMAIKTWMGHWN